MKKLLGILVLGLLLSSNAYAGFGDKAIVLKCVVVDEPKTFFKFKILSHKEKGIRIKTYKVSEKFIKLWDGELLASYKVDEKGSEYITWIRYFSTKKNPSMWLFGVDPKGDENGETYVKLKFYENISGFDSNLKDLEINTFRNKRDRENQSKANDKHWKYVLAKEEVFFNLLDSNKKSNDVVLLCEID